MKRLWMAMNIIIVAALTLGMCGKGSQKYAVVVKNAGNSYNDKQVEGFKKAVSEFGGSVVVKSPQNPTAEEQIEIINGLIEEKVAVIAIAANDPEALQPVINKAMKAGIKILSFDSALRPQLRMVHINQADPERIGRVQIQAIAKMINNKGEIAVLSATSQATNQNLWIEWMKKELKSSKYQQIKLVKIAYGDDEVSKSISETKMLLKSYPNLKGIIAPTTVGIRSAAKILTEAKLQNKVQLTGLGLPSEMAPYIEGGVCQWMYLWNPIDVGYLTGYTAKALVENKITGKAGDSFESGRLGSKKVVQVGNGTEVMLGDPFKFDKDNIAKWKNVY